MMTTELKAEKGSSTCGPSHESCWSRDWILTLRCGSHYFSWAEIKPPPVLRGKAHLPLTTPLGSQGPRATCMQHLTVQEKRGAQRELHTTHTSVHMSTPTLKATGLQRFRGFTLDTRQVIGTRKHQTKNMALQVRTSKNEET